MVATLRRRGRLRIIVITIITTLISSGAWSLAVLRVNALASCGDAALIDNKTKPTIYKESTSI